MAADNGLSRADPNTTKLHEDRTYAVTGATSGIGAATVRTLQERGGRVIACDLADADVVGDLTTSEGRAALVDGVTRLSGGRIDAIVANAGGGPPQTMLSLNFFGAVATLEGLRPLLAASPAPRAVMVSSISSFAEFDPALIEACLAGDERAATAAAGAGARRRQGASRSLRQRQACVEPLVPESGGGTAMGRRGNTAECDRARGHRHPRRRPNPVGSRLESADRKHGPDARRLSRLARAACRLRGLVCQPGKRTDDGTDSVCRRRL